MLKLEAQTSSIEWRLLKPRCRVQSRESRVQSGDVMFKLGILDFKVANLGDGIVVDT